jgi:uncharacterized protein with FMN-binding domain
MEPTAGTGLPQTPTTGPPKRKKHRLLLIIGLSFFGLLIVLGAFVGIYAWRFNHGWKNIAIEDVNLSRVADGTYEGQASNSHDSAQVRVAVQDHRIIDIEIVRVSPSGARDKMEKLVPRIISMQTPNVDIVTGASASSKTFLKAVENALTQAGS